MSTTSKLPARTEGALRLLHLYGKPATAKELRDKNHELPRSPHGYGRPEDDEYNEIQLLMLNDLGDNSAFWFADGIMYGLEQAWVLGLVEVVDGVYNPELVRDFLRKSPKDRKFAGFTRSRVRYELTMWGKEALRQNAQATDQ